MFTAKDINFFNLATAFARISSHREYLIGAVLVKNGNVLSSATNIHKSHPVQRKYNAFRNMDGSDNHTHELHAEINCMLKVKNKQLLKNSSIYVSRIGKDDVIRIAKPCKACQAALKDYGIKDLYYTTTNSFTYERLK